MIPEDRRADFDAHGWLVFRDVVSAERLRQLNRIFDQLMEAFIPRESKSSGQCLWQVHSVCRSNELLLRHLHEGIGEFVSQLINAPSVRLLQDALLLKAPGKHGSVATHQDYTYTGFLDPPGIVSVGLALTDSTIENGCLYVVDESHKRGLSGDFQILADKLRGNAVEEDQIRTPLEVRAGDVTIHHCLTMHGSYPNTSPNPRKTIVTHLFNSECRLVQERLPREARGYFQTDNEGRLTGPSFPTFTA